jgi:hypothetical protein
MGSKASINRSFAGMLSWLVLSWTVPVIAANPTRLDLNGIGLGATTEDIERIYPKAICVRYRYRADADTECKLLPGSLLFNSQVAYATFKLINNRVIHAEAKVLGSICFVLPILKEHFGHPLRRYEYEDPHCGPGISEWKVEPVTLTASGCVQSSYGSCDTTLTLTDSRNAKLYAERARAIQAQRPVVSNLTPSQEHLAAGRTLLQRLMPVMDMRSLTPVDIKSVLGLELEFVRESYVNNDRVNATRREFKVTGDLPYGVDGGGTYQISWGYSGTLNGGSLRLPIDSFRTCITESLLEEELGLDRTVSRSSPVHFGRDSLAPKGIRGRSESWVYENAYGISLWFTFSYISCASSVSLRDSQPKSWVPNDVTIAR